MSLYKFISASKEARDDVAAKLAGKGGNNTESTATVYAVKDADGKLLAVEDKEPDTEGYKKLNDEKKTAEPTDLYIVESDVLP